MPDTLVPFELHITLESLVSGQEPAFLEFCTGHAGKPLLIMLERGQNRSQPMFTKVLELASVSEAVASAVHYAALLHVAGFTVSRTKIEIPATKAFLFDQPAGGETYFEWHGKVNNPDRELLLPLCRHHQAHLSYNSLREETGSRFVTLRVYEALPVFEAKVAALRQELESAGWPVLKEQSEYCVHDSNVLLDKGWLAE